LTRLERNNRIADSLETGLKQFKENMTLLASAPHAQLPQDRIQNIFQEVDSLDDTLADAVSIRVEIVQQNNATTWAMLLADLVDVALSNYGNARSAPFDLTNMSNLANMEMTHANNMTMMNDDPPQMSGESNSNNTMTMMANSISSMSNLNITIVDVAAYQSAQYLANNTILQLFYDTLKPLTITANETSEGNINDNALPCRK
jgi:hypothetical protein